jgi:hypothetical protein
MGAFLLFNVLQNYLERVKIGVDIRYDRKLHALLSNYFEPAKFILRIIPNYVFFLYKMLKAGVTDTLPKSFQFVFDAFGEQFDPAIGEIPDRARDFESVCD